PLPIIGDEAIDPEFGTGVLKVTPAHDKVDFEIGQRHDLPVIDVLHPNGKINCPAVPELDGLDRFAARKKAAELLAERGLLAKEEPHESTVGFSERAGVPIEPRLSEQWFLRYPKVAEARASVGKGNKIRFRPERWENVYQHWLENIQDWCISRQLWWGHRIPVWYNENWAKVRDKTVPIVRQDWDTISGATAHELRENAWRFAHERGYLNSDFLNRDAGFNITVQRSSLKHAFSNVGLANIKLVPALPQLLKHARRVAILAHEPPAREVVQVHLFFAAIHLGRSLYRVKFTVKEFTSRLRLYDHQTVEVQKVETDGKNSPEEAAVSRSFAPWPASVSEITLADLVANVNRDNAVVRCQIGSPGEGWMQDPDVLDT
ncbi:MAG: class I tRNA ligase family protein, partial [Rhodanobacteraceae bacterium]